MALRRQLPASKLPVIKLPDVAGSRLRGLLVDGPGIEAQRLNITPPCHIAGGIVLPHGVAAALHMNTSMRLRTQARPAALRCLAR